MRFILTWVRKTKVSKWHLNLSTEGYGNGGVGLCGFKPGSSWRNEKSIDVENEETGVCFQCTMLLGSIQQPSKKSEQTVI